jgi:hypothetical protein
VLGEQTPFGAAVKFDKQYWLGIQVQSEPNELSPRIALTSVGYSFSSLRADTASVSVASLADTTWRHSGANIYRLNGNVGIGTANPTLKLHVGDGDVNIDYNYAFRQSRRWVIGGTPTLLSIGDATSIEGRDIRFDPGFAGAMIIKNGTGYVGIGTTGPNHKLQVVGGDIFTDSIVRINDVGFLRSTTGIFQIQGGGTGTDFRNNANNSTLVRIQDNGNVGIGTTTPSVRLEVIGRTKTNVLEITGGMDLAEPFEISESQPIPKGALVIIDEDNPGRLKLSHRAYDKRVAGVVSGAGGINPGLTLTQEGVLEGGQNVALSGRVYALATATNGPIKPGDLLTTSEVPGHAMKATDQARWPGAVIGKAMSKLEQGEGLVLVLIQPH